MRFDDLIEKYQFEPKQELLVDNSELVAAYEISQNTDPEFPTKEDYVIVFFEKKQDGIEIGFQYHTQDVGGDFNRNKIKSLDIQILTTIKEIISVFLNTHNPPHIYAPIEKEILNKSKRETVYSKVLNNFNYSEISRTEENKFIIIKFKGE